MLYLPSTRLSRSGLGLCVGGLLVALTSFMPGIVPPGDFPWPVLVGSAIYLPGSFMAFFGCKKEERRQTVTTVRLIRFGFVATLVVSMVRIFGF